MKSVVFGFAICALAVICYARPEDQYTTKYDDFKVEEVVQNERLLKSYLDCLLEEPGAKCTAEGKELKTHITDALETECAKCNDKQKEKIKYVINFLIKEKPEYWGKLKAKYDPDNKYADKYEEKARKEGLIP